MIFFAEKDFSFLFLTYECRDWSEILLFDWEAPQRFANLVVIEGILT
jgi:hypothetical protein